MFGRRPRVKSLDQVGRELDALRVSGVPRVFFVDDNLIGNRPKAKELLAFLAEYQARHDYCFSFGTEATLNLARDAELARLMVAAGFVWVFIGIETTDEESLKETKKPQNVGGDIRAEVRRMYTSEIDELGGFIVGFDNDTLATFDRARLTSPVCRSNQVSSNLVTHRSATPLCGASLPGMFAHCASTMNSRRFQICSAASFASEASASDEPLACATQIEARLSTRTSVDMREAPSCVVQLKP